MWSYDQSCGDLRHNGRFFGTGYSGAGRTLAEGRNNPAMEGVQAKGPIPLGRWKIGPVYDHPHLGPVCMNLEPIGHDARGRSAFRIHGNNQADDASHGCIILGRPFREMIVRSNDRDLEVIP